MSTKAADINAIAGFDLKSAGTDILKLMKSAFDMTFANVVKMQDFTEKMMRDSAEFGKSMQAEATKMADLALENAKKGRMEYRKAVEEGFKKVEESY